MEVIHVEISAVRSIHSLPAAEPVRQSGQTPLGLPGSAKRRRPGGFLSLRWRCYSATPSRE